MKLTEHFNLQEFIKSETARRLNIDNTPNEDQLFYLQNLANELEKIRLEYQKPIVISSGYRCEKLNAKVGGAKNSQHCTGAAADFHSLSDTLEDNKELWDVIMRMYKDGKLAFRQIIWEYGDQKIGPSWIHCAVQDDKHSIKRNEILHILS